MTELELTPEDVAANRAAWVDALRSGRYAQGHTRLRTRDDGYCCLGVAEDLRGARWGYLDPDQNWHDEPNDQTYPVVITDDAIGYEAAILTVEGARWLGLDTDPVVAFRDPNPTFTPRPYRVASLAELNDTLKLSFAEIASVIADQPPNWDGDAHATRADVDARNAAHREESS